MAYRLLAASASDAGRFTFVPPAVVKAILTGAYGFRPRDELRAARTAISIVDVIFRTAFVATFRHLVSILAPER